MTLGLGEIVAPDPVTPLATVVDRRFVPARHRLSRTDRRRGDLDAALRAYGRVRPYLRYVPRSIDG